MSYASAPPSFAILVLRGFGWVALAVLLLIAALIAPMVMRSRSLQYYVYVEPAGTQGLRRDVRDAGCEIFGRFVTRDGQKAIRYRFPNDPELEECFLEGVPRGARIEKASWLETQLSRPRPVWL